MVAQDVKQAVVEGHRPGCVPVVDHGVQPSITAIARVDIIEVVILDRVYFAELIVELHGDSSLPLLFFTEHIVTAEEKVYAV